MIITRKARMDGVWRKPKKEAAKKKKKKEEETRDPAGLTSANGSEVMIEVSHSESRREPFENRVITHHKYLMGSAGTFGDV